LIDCVITEKNISIFIIFSKLYIDNHIYKIDMPSFKTGTKRELSISNNEYLPRPILQRGIKFMPVIEVCSLKLSIPSGVIITRDEYTNKYINYKKE
jgi:hypothetical protein